MVKCAGIIPVRPAEMLGKFDRGLGSLSRFKRVIIAPVHTGEGVLG